MNQTINIDKELSLNETIEAGRKSLLKKIEKEKNPQTKLINLIELRKAEWTVPGYQNSLSILSDTTYQDRKHFLLELIQNADDAAYEGNSAVITFTIKTDCLILYYNEKGFSFDDVFSITDTGKSTKKKDKYGASSFIGEKGIGFKSVFALAKEVEIESPPWHFKLTKKEPIIPIPIVKENINKGTQIKITFIDPNVIDDIAYELDSFIGGSMESFLFLRKLSTFTIEDHRYSPPLYKKLDITPPSREGSALLLKTFPDNSKRDYIIYSEQITFPGELVADRWEQLAGVGALKRAISLAALLKNENDKLPHGKLFCFLPTRVSLPIPVFLQVDGATISSREELHDLKYNSWNRYLVEQLPEFLLHAIIFLRDNTKTARCLPEYIPHDQGMDQLKEVFVKLKEQLQNVAWVKTCDTGADAWAMPNQVIMTDAFMYSLLTKNKNYRTQVEKKLNKKFMSPDWAFRSEWEIKWVQYGIERLQEYHIAQILAYVPLPKVFLGDDENLLSLYEYLLNMKAFRGSKNWDVLNLIKKASIFPILHEGFAPLIFEGNDEKVYYLSAPAVQRQTGVGRLSNYRLVEPGFTYSYKIDKGLNSLDAKRIESIKINNRNKIIRNLLSNLDIEDLNNDTLLSKLQIPWLLDPDNAKPKFDRNRYLLINAIFEAFNSKRDYDSEYLAQLERLKDAPFRSDNDKYLPLCELALPAILRMEEADDMYFRAGIPTVIIPAQYFEPPSSTSRYRSKDEKVNIRKYREKWRDFLGKCGLRVRPGWKTETIKYENCSDFRIKDYLRWKLWIGKIKNEYTENNPVEISYIQLDEITLNIIRSPERDLEKLAYAIYDSWKTQFGSLLNLGFRSRPELIPGYFNAKHKRNTEKTVQIKDTLWAGVEPVHIPIFAINKIAVPSGLSLKVDREQLDSLQTSIKYLTMVSQTNDLSDYYHNRYLESLNILSPTMQDVNMLWGKYKSSNYDEIIQVATELLEINISPNGLMLFDKTINDLRPYDDFRLGKTTLNDIPMIEKQYGDKGRLLGQKLELRSESKLSSYKQLIKKVYSKLPKSLEQNHVSIRSMLNEWSALGLSDQKDLIQTAEQARTEENSVLPIVITYNQDDWAQLLKEAGYPVLALTETEQQKFKLQRAAQELGFLSLEETGKLETIHEQNLNESEQQILVNYLNTFKHSLEVREITVLEEKLKVMGKIENLPSCFKRVKSAYRNIELKNKSHHIDVALPILDIQTHTFWISEQDSIPKMLALFLSVLEFGPYRSVYRDLQEMQNEIEHIYLTSENIDNDKRKDKKDPQNSVKIAQEIKESLVDNRPISDEEGEIPWKSGLSPDQEEIFRAQLMESYKKSLEAGPKEYEKKAKLHNQHIQKSGSKRQVVIDPGAVNPKEFLKNEYGGRCQLCGTILSLVNGDKWVETYHILEKRGEEWLKDRPFNILGLCPNCHALAKHGGRNLNNVFEMAKELEQGRAIPQEIPMYHMDAYVTKVLINGEEKELVMSKTHLNYMAVVFADLITVEDEIAAIDEKI